MLDAQKLCVSSNLATAAVNESTNHEQLIYMAKNNLENVLLNEESDYAPLLKFVVDQLQLIFLQPGGHHIVYQHACYLFCGT